MTADVILYAGAVTPERTAGCDAAVIDVFRATSVIVEAAANGAEAVIPVAGISEAFMMREAMGCENMLLGGERQMVIVEGFDLGNSPASYTREAVGGKTVIFSTTNGTRAILNSRGAENVYVASFLNIGAACRTLAAGGRDVVLVCSGRQDRFTYEDGACAGAMAAILAGEYGYRLTDIADLLRREYAIYSGSLRERLGDTRHYNDMMRAGLAKDIEYCLRQDIHDITPRFTPGGKIIP